MSQYNIKTIISVSWRLIIIFIAYFCLGFLLKFYQAQLIIWLFTIMSILYLSWCGTGAIAIVVFFTFLIVGFSVYIIKVEIWLENFISFENFEIYYKLTNFIYSLHKGFFQPTLVILLWALSFLLIWILSTFLAFYHGFTQDLLEEKINQKFSVFSCLSLVSLTALKLGQII